MSLQLHKRHLTEAGICIMHGTRLQIGHEACKASVRQDCQVKPIEVRQSTEGKQVHQVCQDCTQERGSGSTWNIHTCTAHIHNCRFMHVCRGKPRQYACPTSLQAKCHLQQTLTYIVTYVKTVRSAGTAQVQAAAHTCDASASHACFHAACEGEMQQKKLLFFFCPRHFTKLCN